MNGLEALEEIKDDMEYVTRLDFVEPIVRGEVRDNLFKIYHKELPHLDTIEKELKTYHRLIKALDLKQPIFVKDFQGVCEFDDTIVSSRFITNGNQLALVDDFGGESMYLNLNEYGETWALTKEELEE